MAVGSPLGNLWQRSTRQSGSGGGVKAGKGQKTDRSDCRFPDEWHDIVSLRRGRGVGLRKPRGKCNVMDNKRMLRTIERLVNRL